MLEGIELGAIEHDLSAPRPSHAADCAEIHAEPVP